MPARPNSPLHTGTAANPTEFRDQGGTGECLLHLPFIVSCFLLLHMLHLPLKANLTREKRTHQAFCLFRKRTQLKGKPFPFSLRQPVFCGQLGTLHLRNAQLVFVEEAYGINCSWGDKHRVTQKLSKTTQSMLSAEHTPSHPMIQQTSLSAGWACV